MSDMSDAWTDAPGDEPSDDRRRAIVVGLDASPLSIIGLRAAAVVARRWGARVEVVHVEDSAVARLPSHPGVVTVCGLTAVPGRSHWRRKPSRLRSPPRSGLLAMRWRPPKALLKSKTGAPSDAELVFRRRRGGVTRELRAVVGEAAPSLLVVGWTGQSRARWHRAHGLRLGSTAPGAGSGTVG